MNLLDNLMFLAGQKFTLRYTGTVNIESGWAELKSFSFPACSECSNIAAFTVDCESCGRSKGASFSFLAGDGDGVYSSVGWFDPENHSLVASLWVFDESTNFATKVDDEVRAGEIDGNSVLSALIDAVRPYVDLPGLHIGSIASGGPDLMVSDRNARPNVDVQVPLPLSEGKSFELLTFMESVAESSFYKSSLQRGIDKNLLNGGLNEAVRPRVLFAINTQWSESLIGNNLVSDREFNWEEQLVAWQNLYVFSNFPGTENGRVAAYNNGIISLKYSADLPIRSPEGMFYSLEAVSWLLQAAYLGDGDARGLAEEYIEMNFPQMLSKPEVMKRLLGGRGCEESDELVKFLETFTG